MMRQDFLRDARALGRSLSPDLATALANVELRARAEVRRRPKLALVAALAGVMMLTVGLGNGLGVLTPGPTTHQLAQGATYAYAAYAPKLQVTGEDAVAAGLADCAAASTSIQLAFDHASYAVGQPVGVRVVLINEARDACRVPLDLCASSIQVLSATGVVYDSASDPRLACGRTPGADGKFSALPHVALKPGGIAQMLYQWRPGVCAGACNLSEGSRQECSQLTVVGAWAGFDAPGYKLTSLPRHLAVNGAPCGAN